MITMAAMGSICRPQLPTRPLPVLKARNCRGNSTVRVRAAASGTRGRRPQNAEGDFFVDERCIDCDACRWLAPETFTRIGGQSAVFRQPNSEEERFRALQALLCCPTASIRTEKPPKEIRAVQSTFPLPVDEQSLPGVYHCGYHSERTYGATSYLIVHPEGNILVDSPKYKEILARRIDTLGGVRYMFLTHKDDVGDHQLWSKRFSCERILHSGDTLRLCPDRDPLPCNRDAHLLFPMMLPFPRGAGALPSSACRRRSSAPAPPPLAGAGALHPPFLLFTTPTVRPP